MFITTGLAYGGAETQLVRLTERLVSRSWELSVISLLTPQAYTEELERSGIKVFSLGLHRRFPDPRAFAKLVKIIRCEQPAVITSFMIHANLLARFARPITRVPILICSARNITESGRIGSLRIREILYKLTDPLCDITVQNSRAGFERYIRKGIVPENKMKYIPNGVDTLQFRPNIDIRNRLRKELRLEGKFVWLTVGRFDPQKDYQNLLQAFSQVTSKESNTRLLVIGDGPLNPIIKNLSRDLGLRDSINFLGIRRDVDEILNAADGFVLASSWEGLPNVLLESASVGLPIVATDVGGNLEILVNEKTGFAVPPKDSDSLARAMIRLMLLPERVRLQMKEASREHILNHFSFEQVVAEWENLFLGFWGN